MRDTRFGRTLTARAVFVACAVALVSVLVTALTAVPLAVREVERQARETLAEESRLLAEAIPGARFVLVPGAGHAAVTERPAEVAAAMLDFWGLA